MRGLRCAVVLVVIFCLFWLGEKPEALSLLSLDYPFDRLEHILLFGLLAALLRLSTTSASSCFVLVTMMVVAAGDDFHQRYLPGRIASLVDFAADLVGIVLGLMLLVWLCRRKAPQAS